ncbi:cysteine-rich protein 2-binding protein [Orussus abietinus]|uniref:cysteine-rich protein 2-binding protein n=1 Tax=Orussus abietinus TaxID=222816 RepID=UPI0006253635|nr:cysteine-rich protein 2-binding protein [Orussus abietinus]
MTDREESLGESSEVISEAGDEEVMDMCARCGKICDAYENPALTCAGDCGRKIHVTCLSRGGVPGSLVGDVFFELHCVNCNSFREETLVRKKIPWLTVIALTLYNLQVKSSGISKQGYFHWKSDISMFIDRNWDYLFRKNVKRKKNWTGTISGTLSHYSGVFFKSGIVELEEPGWWKLMANDPPEILIAKNCRMMLNRKQKAGISSKSIHNREQCSDPTTSKGNFFFDDNSSKGESFVYSRESSMHSIAEPSISSSDFLLPVDINDLDILDTDDTCMDIRHESQTLAELMQDVQQQSFQLTDHHNSIQMSQLLDNFMPDWASCDTKLSECNNYDESLDRVDDTFKDELYENRSTDSPVSMQEQPLPSLFNSKKQRRWPWLKDSPIGEKKFPMSELEESYLLQKVCKSRLDSAKPSIRRLYRKLAVRKLKREYDLPLLDVDKFHAEAKSYKKCEQNERVLDRFCSDLNGAAFEQRLQGHNEPTSVHSPYTNRLLKPFIRRDTTSRPTWLRLMNELLLKVNGTESMSKVDLAIDYSYVRPQHIPAINSLCSQFFWPGIDLTECLQYPDFSCVVLYKKLVIGVAVLIPDVGYNEAYISFLVVRPEWRRAGIGTFMLYHLIQTCMGKDVTLHVSATNPALILYQKFGFKIEEFVQDFYDKYMPPNSKECRHALFLRLNR